MLIANQFTLSQTQFFANLRWLHVMTVEISCHINLLNIGGLFILVYSFIVVNKNYSYLKDIDMSISSIEKFIILTEDVALLTKLSWERRQIWFTLYASLNIRARVGARIRVWTRVNVSCGFSQNFYFYFLSLHNICTENSF